MAISVGPIRLVLELDGGSDEQADVMARSLARQLDELGAEAELLRGAPAPQGTKGDSVTVGSIAIAVLPTLLPKVLDFLGHWVGRQSGPTVKLKTERDGKTIEFTLSGGDIKGQRAVLEGLGLLPPSPTSGERALPRS